MPVREPMDADEVALLAAIHAHPDEDTPRLVYADWLDEHAETDAERGRAELIRVQCQLVKWACARADSTALRAHVCGVGYGGHMLCQPLRLRERDLIHDNAPHWRAGPVCERCAGAGRYRPADGHGDRVDCPACWHTGDRGGLLREFDYDTRPGERTRHAEPVRITYDRGFGVVQVPRQSDLLGEEPWWPSKDRGRSAWLRAVVTHHPHVVGVVPLDREPARSLGGLWVWRPDLGMTDDTSQIPDPVYALRGSYPTRDAAVTALGLAFAAWGRRKRD